MSDTPSAPPSAPRRPAPGRLGGFAVFLAYVAALSLLFGALCPRDPPGEVFFTGLDDTAQTALARSLGDGAPLVGVDEAFAAVPPEVRPDLLYRPSAARKTRDLARQIDPDTCAARPFFQPFLPWQRAHLPGLPRFLALLVLLLFGVAVETGFRTNRPRVSPPLPFFVFLPCLLLAVFAFLPWTARFAGGPFAEGPATLLAAFALALSFAGAEPDAPAGYGVLAGAVLGLAVSFHPILAAWCAPIALFSVLRHGRARHTLALALGIALGLAPLLLSTAFVTAPYGNFLRPATLRAMIAGSADIRALAAALGAALALGAAVLAAAHAPRLRALAARPRVRTALSLLCAAGLAAALAAALLHPAARRALDADFDGLRLALPGLLAAVALAFVWRRPATCFLLAAGAAASLPYFIVQGQEVAVGIWSLRRSLTPLALFSLAAALAAFETDSEEEALPPAARIPRARLRAGLFVLLAACGALQWLRLPAGAARGGEDGGAELVARVRARLRPDALHLFDHFPHAAPFASQPGLTVFGLNEALARSLGHGRVAAWLRDECARRPVFVVSSAPVAEPVLDDGIALVPDGAPVSGTVSRTVGRTFGTARPEERRLDFTFLRVRPAARGDATTLLFGHSPFGLSGAWDVPRRGRTGRWAAEGAAFWGPVPAPGGTVEIEADVSWWTRAGTNAPPQRLRVSPPFAGTAAEAVLEPSRSFRRVVLRLTRDPDDASDLPPAGLYRLSGSEHYDERGFPPALLACFRRLRALDREGAFP